MLGTAELVWNSLLETADFREQIALLTSLEVSGCAPDPEKAITAKLEGAALFKVSPGARSPA